MKLSDEIKIWQDARRKYREDQARKFNERARPGDRVQAPILAPPTYEDQQELGEFFAEQAGESVANGIRAFERAVNEDERQALHRRFREDDHYLSGPGAATVHGRMEALMSEGLSPREALLQAAREVRDGG